MMVIFKPLLLALIFLTPFYFVPVVLCALAIKFGTEVKWRKENIKEAMWLPIINIFEGVVGLGTLLEIPFKLQKRYNQAKRCDKCGVVSYYGRTLIHNKFDGSTTICPCCEDSTACLWETDKPVVVGTKLSLLESWSLHHSISNVGKLKVKHKNLDYIDSQMEKYLAVQEEKLAKMNKKEEI